MTFTGLSSFPITPITESGIDAPAFGRVVQRLAAARVDSIGALGSTGSYAYLSRSERALVARLAVEHASGVPVMTALVGCGPAMFSPTPRTHKQLVPVPCCSPRCRTKS